MPLTLRGPLPMVVAPSLNVTVPVGKPAPSAVGDTVALSVTFWPKTEGLADETSTVAVNDWLTT